MWIHTAIKLKVTFSIINFSGLEHHRDTLLNSTSSSNESVSSISSRDLSHSQMSHPNNHPRLMHNQFNLAHHANLSSSQGQLNLNSQNQMMLPSHGSPINHHGSPVKTRRVVNHSMGVHYAPNYRPQSHQNM